MYFGSIWPLCIGCNELDFVSFFIIHLTNERTIEQTEWLQVGIKMDIKQPFYFFPAICSLYIRSFELWCWALVCRTMQDWMIGDHIAVTLRGTLRGHALCQVVLKEWWRRFQGKFVTAFLLVTLYFRGDLWFEVNILESCKFFPAVCFLPKHE